jgi:hypothetical protein
MSYTITIRGGETYSLDDTDGFDLKVKWLEAKKPFPIELDDDTLMSSQIVKITKNRATEADAIQIPDFDAPVLLQGNRCRGQYSIQREINRIAKDEGGRDWAKLVKDKSWRANTRKTLRGTGALWCDYIAGECACDHDFKPVYGRHNV